MIKGNISSAFSQNRTEELTSDVWGEFVTPRFMSELDLLSATKPHVITGGRGCGKTMLLRYYSFESQFSKRRIHIPESAYKNIGLYWRIDTQFASVMHARGIDFDSWVLAFEHFLGVYTSIQILQSLKTISTSNGGESYATQINLIRFDALQAFGENFKGGIDAICENLKGDLKYFEMWVSNVKKIKEPIFLPKSFLSEVISIIRAQCDLLQQVNFHVYIDEFENLLDYQQRVVNTRIKHSQPPLIFNVAVKRRGFTTKETLGLERISDLSDYRQIDLEYLILKSDFELFAAEVFLLHLANVGYEKLPVRIETLRDKAKLSERMEPGYRNQVVNFVYAILPGLSLGDIAKRFFTDKTLNKILIRKIEKGLKDRFGSIEEARNLIDRKYPKESIVCSALVYRSKLNPQIIKDELNRHRLGEKSKFPNWVENNLVGCILQLYDSYDKVCPIYGGFETFTKLARGNLRYLLELCHKSLASSYMTDYNDLPQVSVDVQAQAARQASAAYLQEVRSFGAHGNRLHTFVLRIGSLFALSHGRSGQSEPEVNHFSFKDKASLSESHEQFLNEAIKWTVLFEEQETKLKDSKDGQQLGYEYILNPIYAPYFNISYRKRRRLEMKVAEFQEILEGDYESVKRLLRSYSRRWKADLEDSNPTLFSHLAD